METDDISSSSIISEQEMSILMKDIEKITNDSEKIQFLESQKVKYLFTNDQILLLIQTYPNLRVQFVSTLKFRLVQPQLEQILANFPEEERPLIQQCLHIHQFTSNPSPFPLPPQTHRRESMSGGRRASTSRRASAFQPSLLDSLELEAAGLESGKVQSESEEDRRREREEVSRARPASEEEVEAIVQRLKEMQDSDSRISFLREARGPLLFSSAQLLAVLGSTESVKTQVSAVALLGPRLLDPQALRRGLEERFRYAEDREVVARVLRTRQAALSTTTSTTTSTPPDGSASSSLLTSGSGSGQGQGRGRRVSVGQQSLAAQMKREGSQQPIHPVPSSTPTHSSVPFDLSMSSSSSSSSSSSPSSSSGLDDDDDVCLPSSLPQHELTVHEDLDRPPPPMFPLPPTPISVSRRESIGLGSGLGAGVGSGAGVGGRRASTSRRASAFQPSLLDSLELEAAGLESGKVQSESEEDRRREREEVSRARPASEEEVEVIVQRLREMQDSDSRISFLREARGPLLFSSAQLLAVLGSTESVKTQVSAVALLGPRLLDPQALRRDLEERFRYAEDREVVARVLRTRQAALSTPLPTSSSSSLSSGSGSGQGRVQGRGRRVSVGQQSLAAQMKREKENEKESEKETDHSSSIPSSSEEDLSMPASSSPSLSPFLSTSTPVTAPPSSKDSHLPDDPSSQTSSLPSSPPSSSSFEASSHDSLSLLSQISLLREEQTRWEMKEIQWKERERLLLLEIHSLRTNAPPSPLPSSSILSPVSSPSTEIHPQGQGGGGDVEELIAEMRQLKAENERLKEELRDKDDHIEIAKNLMKKVSEMF